MPMSMIRFWRSSSFGAQRVRPRRLACCGPSPKRHIGGIKNNVAFFRDILQDPQFAAGAIHTGFIAEHLARRQAVPPGPDSELPIYSRRSRSRVKRKRRLFPWPPNPVLNGCVKDAHAFCVSAIRLREAPCNPASR